jgi:mRNA-degrading endonuclease RelE of RelBE toxin-antitoxin system
MPFQPEYSQFFKTELVRLDGGNTTEKKRAHTARSKIAAVCQAPYSPTYSKDLPGQYGAVAVTGRFRLFFKIHSEHSVVFFTWINDESNIHASGAANDAYQEFRRQLANDEIEKYQHVSLAGEEFTFNGDWGNSYIYIEFLRSLSDQTNQKANSSLTLNQTNNSEYAISSIDVSDENIGLAQELIKRMLMRAEGSCPSFS